MKKESNLREIRFEPTTINNTKMKEGIELIAEERKRQIEKEGWTPEHDDLYKFNELALAAATYALPLRIVRQYSDDGIPRFWPFSMDWYKPSEDRIRALQKAGALIAAEIDRLQRINQLNKPTDKEG